MILTTFAFVCIELTNPSKAIHAETFEENGKSILKIIKPESPSIKIIVDTEEDGKNLWFLGEKNVLTIYRYQDSDVKWKSALLTIDTQKYNLACKINEPPISVKVSGQSDVICGPKANASSVAKKRLVANANKECRIKGYNGMPQLLEGTDYWNCSSTGWSTCPEGYASDCYVIAEFDCKH